MNPNLKRHLISFGTTFVAGFAIALVSQIDSITLTSIRDGAAVGVFFAGIRSGVKAVLEAFVAWYTSK